MSSGTSLLHHGLNRALLRRAMAQLIPSRPQPASSILRASRSPLNHIPHPRNTRALTITPPLYKKGGKAASKHHPPPPPANSEASDPYDLSHLEAANTKAIEHLKDELSKLRQGGRFNPEILEGLKVQLAKGGGAGSVVKLGEVAQVVPRGGRQIAIVAGEKEHLKPLTTSLLASNLNLNPQPDAQSPGTTLLIPLPPPTKESRLAALNTAQKAAESAYTAIRAARQAQQKKFRSLELNKVVRPDDLRKAHKSMEDVVERGNAEVKKVVEGAKKVLEGGS
ncbi:MAG: hypothetical protein M1819_001897 [Sarea resinae]|nr:MAG: hypothetical protein M1819_001897 [Sarea resinae]